MADEKKNTGPETSIVSEAPSPENTSEPLAPSVPEPEAKQGTIPGMEEKPDPTETVINLAAARKAAKEKPAPEAGGPKKDGPSAPGRDPRSEDEKAPWERPLSDLETEKKPARRGRPPKAAREAPGDGRPGAKDKPEKSRAPKKEKVPRTVKEKGGGGPVSGPAAGGPPAPDAPAQEPGPPPRPVEEGKTVYLKLSELHAFHTFREHPFKVVDDAAMTDLVSTIKEHGVMTPATVRPEKDGSGYEIIAGHRRQRGSELAGLAEIPCIIRDMTDHEAVREMKNSNKQRGDPLPSERARLLDLEVEDIKHQGGRLSGVAVGDIGKRSIEIVGENNGMNYKQVQRYIRLTSLVPELLDKVDAKKMGFTPAVEISFIKPKNQRLIAVSIEGEQSSPSLSQAQELRKLDKEGRLNGDAIDGILSQQKKEVDKVIISTAELAEYFGKDKTPREMKDQILALLGEWKDKQPPELGKAEKKVDKEK